MQGNDLSRAAAGLLLSLPLFLPPSLLAAPAQQQEAPAAVKRPFQLPPSADLRYELSARQRGFGLKGEAVIVWRAGDGQYSVSATSKLPLLGTITEDRSSGAVDAYGLAPAEFHEKRMRKDPTTTTFDREAKLLRFSESRETYPLKGGEQDRVSVTWQLAAVARGAGAAFRTGSQWPFFVAGRRDAETWVFKVVRREKIQTGLGEVETVLLARQPLPDKQDQSLEIWLAPRHDWYPVRLRYADGDKEQVEQTLATVSKK